jgi:ATP-binding cassette, subfamily A (ABC1), member 3
MLFMYILPVFTIVSLIVKEKESKARESMRMMGMTDFPYWLSWFVYYTVINTALSLTAWGVLCINVIGFSNIYYVFAWIWLYGEAIFGQIIFMQALFQRSKFSGLIAAVVYFTLVLANIPVQSDTTSKLPRFLMSLIPQVASQQIAYVYAAFESANVGIIHSTINEWYYNYTYLEGLICLTISIPLWTLIGLYLDKTLPRDYGRSERWFFCC